MPAGRADYEYFASLNDQQVLASLLRIEQHMKGLEQKGSKSFNNIGNSSSKLGTVMSGAVMGAVSALTTAFVNMASQAVAGIGRIISKSVDLAAEYDLIKKKFTAIFDGNEEAAVQMIDHVKAKATELGLEMNEALNFARSFTPDVAGTDDPIAEIDKLLLALRGLMAEDPVQGAVGARIAIDEAISGTLTSLRRRFEFTSAEIDILKESIEELGQTRGVIDGITKVLERRGFSAEVIVGTYTQAIGQMKALGQEVQTVFGQPVMTELTEEGNKLLETLSENKDNLELFADAMGRVVALVVDFVGSKLNEFLQSLSSKEMLGLAHNLYDLVTNAQTLADILFGLEFDGSFLEDVNKVVDKLNEAAVTAAKIGAIAKAETARMRAEAEALGLDPKYADPLSNKLNKAFSSESTVTAAELAGQEAYNKVIKDSVAVLKDAEKAKEDNKKVTEKLKEAQQGATGSTDELNDAFGKLGEGAEESAVDMEAVEAALEKVADINKDFNRDVEDAYKDHARKLADLDEEIAQKRVDQAIENARAIEDIYQKNTQALEDEATNWSREQADIARKQLRERHDQDKEAAKERIQVELDYQKKIKDINRQFRYEIQDAEENQDALAYIAAVKKRERSVEEAKTERTETQTEVETQIAERQAALSEQQAREIEDARIGHQRALEDLQIRLDHELEAQATEHEREMADLVIYEERKRVELQTALDRQLADAAEARDRKMEDLKDSLDAEVLAMVEAELAKTEAMRQGAEERIRIAQEEAAARAELFGQQNFSGGDIGDFYGQGGAPRANSPLPAGFQSPIQINGRARGGTARGLTVTGEEGLELADFGNATRIIPNHNVGSYLGNMVSGAVTNNSFNASYALNNPAMLTPEQQMITQQISERTAVAVFNRLLGNS